MFGTERRYVKRIVVPTITCGAIALGINIILQNVDENPADQDAIANGIAAAESQTVAEIESLQAAIVSLDQSLTSETSGTVPQADLKAISEQRGRAQEAIGKLENAQPDKWETRLESAYDQVNEYSLMIGEAIGQQVAQSE